MFTVLGERAMAVLGMFCVGAALARLHRRPLLLLPCAALLLLQACAGWSPTGADATAPETSCAARLTAFERRAHDAGIGLSHPRALAAYPAFASSRFLASFEPLALGAEQRRDWLQRLVDAGRERRQLLASMLDADHRSVDLTGELRELDGCARLAAARLPRDESAWRALHAAAQIPDDYSTVQRILGLYPLSAIGVGKGVREYQQSVRDTFGQSSEPTAASTRQRLFPAASARPALPMAAGEYDTLGLRLPAGAAAEALLARHAPIWEIDVRGEFDRPGRPFMDDTNRPRVRGEEAVSYTYLSLTRFSGQVRVQLNYLLWFDQRPPRSAIDSLAGALDGVLWRVTLDDDGSALVYDSIHACGCYHLLFATPRLRLRPEAATLPEPPLVPRLLPYAEKDERIVLRLSSGAHYVQDVRYSREASPATEPGGQRDTYRMLPYDALYAVPHPSGSRSLFDRRGLVRGSERLERFYLWPMGVISPGAMRERGRQATAFLGRRHFDDAFLLDEVFELTP
jgi:hypothetical protein